MYLSNSENKVFCHSIQGCWKGIEYCPCVSSIEVLQKRIFFKTLIDSIDFHILHSMNPDGFEIATEGQCLGEEIGSGRQNANDVSKKKTKKF